MTHEKNKAILQLSLAGVYSTKRICFHVFPRNQDNSKQVGAISAICNHDNDGAIFAYLAALLLGPVKGIEEELIDKFALVAIPFGLVGARLGFVLQNAEYYQNHPLEVIGITPDGLAFRDYPYMESLLLVSFVCCFSMDGLVLEHWI